MTKPKWMRRRREISLRLNDLAKATLQHGNIEWGTKRHKRRFNFKEGKRINSKKYSIFFGSAFTYVRELYRAVGKNQLSKKDRKLLLYGDDAEIITTILNLVYNNWAKIEKMMGGVNKDENVV